MIRTQISLSREMYDLARKEAKQLGISLAELFRSSLGKVLPARRTQPWMRYAGFVETGKQITNEEIDELLYGSKD